MKSVVYKKFYLFVIFLYGFRGKYYIVYFISLWVLDKLFIILEYNIDRDVVGVGLEGRFVMFDYIYFFLYMIFYVLVSFGLFIVKFIFYVYFFLVIFGCIKK